MLAMEMMVLVDGEEVMIPDGRIRIASPPIRVDLRIEISEKGKKWN